MTSPHQSYVLGFQKICQADVAIVGGKGAHLGELSRIEDVRAPAGFCVTTDAYRKVLMEAPSLDAHVDRLAGVRADDRDAIRSISEAIRRTIEELAIPREVAAAIASGLAELGDDAAYAVRSSATAEDLPTASFAGQQDTYLNIVGPAAILEHVRRCWASLYTERAVTYRLRNRFDHRKVHMAVVVQHMVFPQAAGILFTADPVTGNRKVASIDASFGLGEALVSGLVNPDVYKVRDGAIVARTIGTKRIAIEPSPAGGTHEHAIEPARQQQAALTDPQIVRLAQLGRRIEAHFGRPQDIEWCLVAEDFQIVQSRPITTLFPIPEVGDDENHVYVSVGHQQMMTDAIRPLGISLFQLSGPRRLDRAGGRLFVDVTQELASPTTSATILMLGRSDPLIGDALKTLLDRGDFVRALPNAAPAALPPWSAGPPIETDPAIVTELIERGRASIAGVQREIEGKSGAALLDFIVADLEHRSAVFDPRSMKVVMAAMEATWWLNEHLQAWLDEKNVADTLAQSVANNVTSEMGLALLDVADAIRPHPQVVAFLQRVEDDAFLDELAGLEGGPEARAAIAAFLAKYGMRCAGEIDITRPRWSERPTTLIPILLGNIKNFEPGAGARRFEEGRRRAAQKRQEVVERLRALPDGEAKAEETERMIDRLRTFAGYREYPKYALVSRYFIYKQALMQEAARLARSGVLRDPDDIFFLTFQELQEVVRTRQVDGELLRRREEAFRSYEALTPPRVLTSEGEALTGAYRRDDVPAGALVGLAVSAGTIEGRARVVVDIAQAALEPGDILVTAYTDPSWTPLFVAIKGLVTEVGGLMTHGAVIAREYGLPAVVGVEQATRRIRDGQRIRVHGTEGYVELLTPDEPRPDTCS